MGDVSLSTPGDTTIIDELAPTTAVSPVASAKPGTAKVRILSRRLKDDTTMLVVRVPAAGRLTVHGKGVKSVSEQTDQAERLTLRVALTRSEVASLRERRRRLRLTLVVSFKPVRGASSTARTKVIVD